MDKPPELWELQAHARAKKADAFYSPQMRSWSPFFRSQAFWNRYVNAWHEARPVENPPPPVDTTS